MKKNRIALAIILIILVLTLVACSKNDLGTCEHNVVIDEAVSATCTEMGLTEGKHCSKCGEVLLAQTEVPALGHTSADAVKENEIAPTCTTAGSYDSVVYCSVCDAELSRVEVVVAALGHDLIPHDSKTPTCTEVGWEAYETCSRCDYTTYEEIPLAKHTYGEWVEIKLATCTEDGLELRNCICGATETKVIKPTGHSHGATVTYPTCIEEGYTTYTCHCGDTYVADIVAALGHDTIDHEAQAPTCTEIGWEAYVTCSRCDYTTYAEIPATGHTYSSDCDIVCNVCEHERASSVSHTYDNTCDTSCNECGAIREIEHTYSSDCDIICNVCEHERVSSVGHTYDNTCDTSCNECGAIREIEHTYSSDCDIICNVCEHERVSSVNHTYSSDCDTSCNECGATRTTSTAHSDVNPADNSCDVCGERVSTLTFTLSGDGQSYAITDANSNISGDITIPSTYNGKPVTTIGNYAFEYCSSLTSIVIPDSVTTIGTYAFSWCPSLTSVTFGANSQLTTIGSYAFYSCFRLTSIVIPDSVITIGSYAFLNCNSLTSMTIGDSVTTIGSYAFEYCNSLTSVTIGDSVTTIGSSAFEYCYKLVEVYNKSSLNIVAGSEDNGYVGYYALNVYTEEGGSKLSTDENGYIIYTDGADKILVGYVGEQTDLIIPDGIKGINKYAFKDCDSLTSIVIPDGVTTIGSYAFEYCRSLISVTIGDSVATIGDGAFYNCISLTSVTFGENSKLTSIGSGAFEFCSSLSSIVIPDSVTSIGSSAFSGCSSLESLTIPFVGNRAGVTSSDTYQYPLGYLFGESSYTGVATTQKYYGFNSVFTTSTTYYIPSSLKSVTVTGGYIPRGAFENCNNITNITLGDDVTSIGSSAFSGCTSLTSVTIGDSVTSIGMNAFTNCSELTNVYYLGTLEQWCGMTFGNSNSNPLLYANNLYIDGELLTEAVIPNTVTKINAYAFYNYSSLTSVTFEDTHNWQVQKSSTASPVSVTVTDATTNATSLTSTYCDYTWYKTDENGFVIENNGDESTLIRYFGAETEVVIPSGVTNIGSYAFCNNSSLARVTIPDSVTTIGSYAFSGCTSLTDVYYTGTEEQWNSISIGSSNSSLTDATIHYNYVNE